MEFYSRVISILICVVLVSTVFAMAVTGYTFNTVDTGIAEQSSDQYYSAPYSVKMTTTTTTDVAEIVFEGDGTLSDITDLSYWTYTDNTIFGSFYGGIMRPMVTIFLHTEADQTLDGWKADYSSASSDVYLLQAEPFYSNPPALALKTWEKWDAYDTSFPLLWSGLESPDLPYWAPALEDYIDGTATSYPTPYWGSQSFASREYGSLYVVAITFRAGYGGSWSDFEGYIDDVSIGENFDDFGPIDVSVDIKPGSDVNPINLKSRGVVPVAVLTTEDFDAADVDPATVEFAGATPLRWTMEDIDRDGDYDMLFHFKTQELNLDEDSTTGTLGGKTVGGLYFSGYDMVTIVPKAK